VPAVADDPNARALAAAGIRRLPLPTPFSVGRVNCYLIEDEPLTLVDPGPSSAVALEELEARLGGLGRRLDDVGLVLLTHQHHDHAGQAAAVRERSGATVAALEPLAELLGDYERAMAEDDAYQGELMRRHGVPEETWATLQEISRAFRRFGRRVAVDRPLAEGEEVRLAGRRLVALARPGHSPTDTLFLDPAAGVALAGDHLIARTSSNPVIHRQWGEAPRRSALLAYLASLDRTADLDLALVLPGHGDTITDHRGLIAQRHAHHRARAELIAGLLAERPRSAHEIARAIWGDVALRQAFLTLSEVLGHVDLLAAEGRAAEREENGVVVIQPDGRG
jgi:glyoxylase-like metal-dependent hydrolase (beta-lactamase superfamily II)